MNQELRQHRIFPCFQRLQFRDPAICLNDKIHCATDYLPRFGADMASYVYTLHVTCAIPFLAGNPTYMRNSDRISCLRAMKPLQVT